MKKTFLVSNYLKRTKMAWKLLGRTVHFASLVFKLVITQNVYMCCHCYLDWPLCLKKMHELHSRVTPNVHFFRNSSLP